MTQREQDDLLRDVLRRVEPPDGFAGRVLARLPQDRRPERRSASWWRWSPFPKMGWSPAMAAMVAALLGAGSWEYAHWRERRSEAEQARAELVQALEITTGKVEKTKARLFRHRAGGVL